MTIPTDIEDLHLDDEQMSRLKKKLRFQPIDLKIRGKQVLSHAIHENNKLLGYINEKALDHFLKKDK